MEKIYKIERGTQINTCDYFEISQGERKKSPTYIEALHLLRKLFDLLNY